MDFEEGFEKKSVWEAKCFVEARKVRRCEEGQCVLKLGGKFRRHEENEKADKTN